FDQPFAMGAAVVLKGEPVVWIVEVGTGQESPLVVVQRNLHLRTSKAGADQQHSQARLHGRLRRGLGEVGHSPGLGDPRRSWTRRDAPTKLRQVDQPAMQRLVHCACRMRTPARAETPHAYGTVT